MSRQMPTAQQSRGGEEQDGRRLCYDGVEMVGVLRKELRDKTRTERLMKYFKDTRGWGMEAERWLGEEVVAGWTPLEDDKQGTTPASCSSQDDVLDVVDRGRGGQEG